MNLLELKGKIIRVLSKQVYTLKAVPGYLDGEEMEIE